MLSRIKGLILGICLLQASALFAAYKAPASWSQPNSRVEIGSEGYSAEPSDDSAVFQKAINAVHAAGGGKVVVPAGAYMLMNVALKSDVHVIFRKGVTIRPFMKGLNGKAGNIFLMGTDGPVKNVSLSSQKEWAVFDLTKVTGGVRVVLAGDCQNFRIADLWINDNGTTYSSITLTWEGEQDGRARIPVDGLIQNIAAIDADYGYGAIQAHSGRNISFSNIKSVGGVAVRLETGYKKMNLAQSGGLFNIMAEKVHSVNGQAAVFLEPHTMQHGDVLLRNISMEGSEFALYIANGFVSEKKYGKDSGLTPGGFKSITADGVKAVYRDGPIVTRYAHLRYYPEELHDSIVRVKSDTRYTYRGPSIAAVANMKKDTHAISISKVEAYGFKYHPDIITPADLFEGSITHLTEKPLQDLPALK